MEKAACPAVFDVCYTAYSMRKGNKKEPHK